MKIRLPFLGYVLGLMIKFIFQRRLSKFIYLPYLPNTFWHSLCWTNSIKSHYDNVSNDAILGYLMNLQMAMFCLTSNSECQKVLYGKYMNLDILLWNINIINNPCSQPRNGNETTFMIIFGHLFAWEIYKIDDNSIISQWIYL